MAPIEYAEFLVGKALSFNRGAAKLDREIRAVLLLRALRELQAETRRVTTVQPRAVGA